MESTTSTQASGRLSGVSHLVPKGRTSSIVRSGRTGEAYGGRFTGSGSVLGVGDPCG